MIPDIGDILQIALVTAIFVGLLGSVCWISVATYRAVKRIDNQKPALPGDIGNQMAQLQQSVDAIAVEVERIAEAQRFMARLEAEREGHVALPARD